MRIIAGKVGGRRFRAPPGQSTRPTPDRVREALFSILGPAVIDSHVLDLFAGSGALGLEALSRGAAHATFVENNRSALPILRENIESLADGHAEVLATDANRALLKLKKAKKSFDLLFLDPPYDENLWTTFMQKVAIHGLLSDHALVICEHPGKEASPSAPDKFEAIDTRRFGDVAITIYKVELSTPTDSSRQQRSTM